MTDDRTDGNPPSRRRYLGLLGATAASLAGCAALSGADEETRTPTGTPETGTPTETPQATPEPTRRGIKFDRVVDAVTDLGLDPSGERAVDRELQRTLAVAGTLVVFPPGSYRFSETVTVNTERVGILGEGDVRFVPDTGFDSLLFDGPMESLDDVLVENVDVDIRAPNTTTGIRLRCQNRFHVEDVEILGRGTNDSPGGTTSAFLFAIRNADGTGVVRNAVAKKGSRVDGYAGGNGRIGVWVGWSNKGTVRIEGCDFREFGNNGIYASRTPGQVEIVDCYFLNNNVAGARIGGDGSYVENCTVEIDFEKYAGPLADAPTALNTRGLLVEQGLATPGPPLPAGAEIRGCRLVARRSPRIQAVIEQAPQARSLRVRDTEITCDVDGTPAVRRGPPGAISYRPDRQRPPRPYWTRLRNVTIGGNAAGGAAVDLRLAPGSAVVDCEITARGAGRDGVVLAHAPASDILDSDVETTGHPVVVIVDPTTSPDDRLLCLDTGTALDRLGDDAADELTTDPPLFQTLSRNSGTDTVCLGLAPDVSTLPLLDDVVGPLRIGIEALADGVPLGRLLNGTDQ